MARSPPASRTCPVPESLPPRRVARHLDHLFGVSVPLELDQETTEAVANAAREQTGATHVLAVLIELDDGADRIDLGGTIWSASRPPTGSRSGGRASSADGMGPARRRRIGARLPAPFPARPVPWSSASTSRRPKLSARGRSFVTRSCERRRVSIKAFQVYSWKTPHRLGESRHPSRIHQAVRLDLRVCGGRGCKIFSLFSM